MMIEPYFQRDGITLYCGDARTITMHLGHFDALITDPPWPNTTEKFVDDEQLLLNQVLSVATADRVVIHLGCDTDPRFLQAVPPTWQFLRVCWLRYVRPSYKGRLLNGSDVAYVFGKPKPGKVGEQDFLMPGESATEGEATSTEGRPNIDWHPCPRRLQHVTWLVKTFGGNRVLDPFAGSCTTLVAARNFGIEAVGIEQNEEYCERAVDRFKQLRLFK